MHDEISLPPFMHLLTNIRHGRLQSCPTSTALISCGLPLLILLLPPFLLLLPERFPELVLGYLQREYVHSSSLIRHGTNDIILGLVKLQWNFSKSRIRALRSTFEGITCTEATLATTGHIFASRGAFGAMLAWRLGVLTPANVAHDCVIQ